MGFFLLIFFFVLFFTLCLLYPHPLRLCLLICLHPKKRVRLRSEAGLRLVNSRPPAYEVRGLLM